MAINFPSSPTLNQTFTSGNTTYQWDGSSWEVVYILSNPNGLSTPTPNALTIGSGLTGGSFNGSAPVTIEVDPNATQTLTNKTITNLIMDGYIREEVFAISGTTPALSPSNGTIQTWTLTANSTPTQGAWTQGESMTLMINDGSARTITWTSIPVVWVGGSAPTLALTGFTVIQLWEVGTTIYGALVGNVA